MKAIVWTKYGPPEVLQLKEVPKPTPKDNEVLIKVHATTVAAGDTEIRNLRLPIEYRLLLRLVIGLTRPKRVTIPGIEVAGKIEAVGKEVKRFKEGDEVFGVTGFTFGAHAQYVCLPDKNALTIKPSNMTYEEAASAVIGGIESLHFLRAANIQKGQKVLIVGASGSIGTVGVQLAKYFGAEVTGVCSTDKLEMVRSIGADSVIDYTKEDYTKGDKTYEVIFDAIGKSDFSGCKRILNKNGIYLLANPRRFQKIRGLWTSLTTSKKIYSKLATYKTEDLDFLRELIEQGKIRSIIDRSYPLEKIPEAHRYVEKGHKAGNVVITVDHNNKI
ncbi:MAG: NAD(P)-dependent alcohol dehydrogenase [Thermoplasmata archaeon]|nr:MAG: NAD(P)-dependent alcohol dehydrogenase [Thermoplasmata archaeon]